MSVTENLMALGQWSVRLRPDVPQSIIDKLNFFSHVAITDGPEDIRITGDAALESARYVGVLTGRSKSGEDVVLSGAGMALWLGDADDKGAVIETPKSYAAQSFTSVIADLLAGSGVQPGTLHSVTGTYTGRHQYQTPRKAIDYVTSTMNAEWRMRGDGRLDAGTVAQLYPASPRAAVIAKARGTSSSLQALEGNAKTDSDVEDWTSRVLLLASQEEDTIATGSKDVTVNPYVDLFGNPVKRTRMISESETSSASAETRATLHLNRFARVVDSVVLNSTTHTVAGYLAVGEAFGN